MVQLTSEKKSGVVTSVLLNPDWANVTGAKLEILVKEKGPTISQVHTTIENRDLVKG